jgi:hypothetical protein
VGCLLLKGLRRSPIILTYYFSLTTNSTEIVNKRNDIATVARGNIVRPNQLVDFFYQTQRIAFHHFLMLLNTISNSK